MVHVDVGVDDETDLLIGNRPDPLEDALDQIRHLVVHEEDPVGAGQDPDVPPSGRGLEHVDVSLDGDNLHGLHLLSRFGRAEQGPGKKRQKENGKKGNGQEPSGSPWRSIHSSSERERERNRKLRPGKAPLKTGLKAVRGAPRILSFTGGGSRQTRKSN